MNRTTNIDTSVETGGTDIAGIELLVTMIGVFLNIALQIFTIYSQKDHYIKCNESLCGNFEMGDQSE